MRVSSVGGGEIGAFHRKWMHIRVQTRELAVGPIGIIGLNTDSPFNADGRLNGTAIVVRGHAIQRARVDAPYDPLLHPLLRPSIPSRKLCAPFFLVSCSSFPSAFPLQLCLESARVPPFPCFLVLLRIFERGSTFTREYTLSNGSFLIIIIP